MASDNRGSKYIVSVRANPEIAAKPRNASDAFNFQLETIDASPSPVYHSYGTLMGAGPTYAYLPEYVATVPDPLSNFDAPEYRGQAAPSSSRVFKRPVERRLTAAEEKELAEIEAIERQFQPQAPALAYSQPQRVFVPLGQSGLPLSYSKAGPAILKPVKAITRPGRHAESSAVAQKQEVREIVAPSRRRGVTFRGTVAENRPRSLNYYPAAVAEDEPDLLVPSSLLIRPWKTSQDFDPGFIAYAVESLKSNAKSRYDAYAKALRAVRLHVTIDTIAACVDGFYYCYDVKTGHTEVDSLKRLIYETRDATSERMLGEEALRRSAMLVGINEIVSNEGAVMVVEGDSIDVGLHCSKIGYKRPVVLIMGNATTRGGGFLRGSGAQEESIYRRTNMYYRTLPTEETRAIEAQVTGTFVPHIPSAASGQLALGETVYTRDAIVFRHNEESGYAFMRHPDLMDFITACAINRGPRSGKKLGEPMDEREKSETIFIIKSLLARCVDEQADCVVLGALGCGAFNNPPDEIASLMRGILVMEKWARMFKRVVIAVIEDSNSGGVNLQTFREVFQLKGEKSAEYAQDDIPAAIRSSRH